MAVEVVVVCRAASAAAANYLFARLQQNTDALSITQTLYWEEEEEVKSVQLAEQQITFIVGAVFSAVAAIATAS